MRERHETRLQHLSERYLLAPVYAGPFHPRGTSQQLDAKQLDVPKVRQSFVRQSISVQMVSFLFPAAASPRALRLYYYRQTKRRTDVRQAVLAVGGQNFLSHLVPIPPLLEER